MTHDEFFAAAIDPAEPLSTSRLPEIDAHRRECEECRELERDYDEILGLGRLLPMPPREPAFEERILLIAQLAREEPQRKAAPVLRRRFLLAAAITGLLVGLAPYTDSLFMLARPSTLAREPGVWHVDPGTTASLQEASAHLAAARELVSLGRLNEARVEAQFVLTNTKATDDDRRAARDLLASLDRH